MPEKSTLIVMQLWGVLLLATAAVVSLSTGTGYPPAPGKPTVVSLALAAGGVVTLAVGTFIRWRSAVRSSRRQPDQ